MGRSVSKALEAEVNVPDDEMVQYVSALGCAILAHRRLEILHSEADLEAAVPA
jgi:activator of 2-hydroxyglutaryl-CoA dehydratase